MKLVTMTYGSSGTRPGRAMTTITNTKKKNTIPAVIDGAIQIAGYSHSSRRTDQ